jgi:hypothetical protein
LAAEVVTLVATDGVVVSALLEHDLKSCCSPFLSNITRFCFLYTGGDRGGSSSGYSGSFGGGGGSEKTATHQLIPSMSLSLRTSYFKTPRSKAGTGISEWKWSCRGARSAPGSSKSGSKQRNTFWEVELQGSKKRAGIGLSILNRDRKIPWWLSKVKLDLK